MKKETNLRAAGEEMGDGEEERSYLNVKLVKMNEGGSGSSPFLGRSRKIRGVLKFCRYCEEKTAGTRKKKRTSGPKFRVR